MKYEDLDILNELREKGSITEEEYQHEKEKILSDSGSRNTYAGTGKNPLFGLNENTYLMLMHLSQFAGFIVPGLGFIVPIVMWITNKENANVDRHGKNIVNFIISYFIYTVIAGILVLLLVGIPALIAIAVIEFVVIIIAAVKANSGEYWQYPFTFDFIK